MAVIPKLASTIVLMDHRSRVFLTKRPNTMKFLAGFYVFPGGTIEKSDYEIDGKYIKNMKRDEEFDHAHYLAAARELFEEAGVLLCQAEDGSIASISEEKEMNYRRMLLNREIPFLQILKKEGIYLNLETLKYFGHRITPKANPIRFDTRFFLAHLPKGLTPKPDYNEIDHALWLSPEEAISAYHDQKISLALPTIHAIQSIHDYLQGRELEM